MIELLIAVTILVNSERTTPLVPDLTLTQRAQVRAEYLCAHNQWSHDGWTGSFKGLNYNYLGENLAKNFSNEKEAHKALMNSPTHKANIVNTHYQKIGVGKSCGIEVELFAGK